MIGHVVTLIGLGIGTILGGLGLLNPKGASAIVRLIADPQKPEGFAEFRATYGGLFLATHLLGLWLALFWADHDVTRGALLMLGALWGGTAFGRGFAFIVDRTRSIYQMGSILFEGIIAAMIAGPQIIALLHV